MRVVVESVLPCRAELAWEEVQTSRLLIEVARPLLVIRPIRGESLPVWWESGTTIRCRSYLFGFIPLGTRVVRFERIDAARREIQTRESDPLIRRWDHLIKIESLDAVRCRYADDIEIGAGLLTPVVWLFAIVFYRYRQRRWLAVAQRLQETRRLQ